MTSTPSNQAGFDALSYLAANPDLIRAFGVDTTAAAQHFSSYGSAEGRSTTFDALSYEAANPDLPAAFGTDTVAATRHYIEFGFKEGTGHRPYFLEQPAVLWLEKQLDFPHWTEAQIRALPETHISEWAKRTGVPADSDEVRGGGTLAVGGDVPGFSREDLSVFSPAEWETHKGELTFAAWTAAAKVASDRR